MESKKIVTVVLLILLVLIILFNGITMAADEILVDRVNLNYSSLRLDRGETIILIASISPAQASNKELIWISSNDRIVQVVSLSNISAYAMSAEVKALGPGQATITVITASGNKRASCTINVFVPVSTITVSPAEVTIQKGQNFRLAVAVSPQDATDQRVYWESTQPGIVSVDQNGVITGMAPGNARIVARSEENNTVNGYGEVTVVDNQSAQETVAPAQPEPAAVQTVSPVDEEKQSIDYNVIIIGALLLVIIIALIFIINSRRS